MRIGLFKKSVFIHDQFYFFKDVDFRSFTQKYIPYSYYPENLRSSASQQN